SYLSQIPESELDNFRTALKEQARNKTWETLYKIEEEINKMIRDFPDVKTALTICELLQPSSNSRAKDTPRPQNPFMLYRKDLSKVISKIYKPISVGQSSRLASERWKLLDSDSKLLWSRMSKVAKDLHTGLYPDYKYTPVRNHKKSDKRKGRRCRASSDFSLNNNLDYENIFQYMINNTDNNADAGTSAITNDNDNDRPTKANVNFDHPALKEANGPARVTKIKNTKLKKNNLRNRTTDDDFLFTNNFITQQQQQEQVEQQQQLQRTQQNIFYPFYGSIQEAPTTDATLITSPLLSSSQSATASPTLSFKRKRRCSKSSITQILFNPYSSLLSTQIMPQLSQQASTFLTPNQFSSNPSSSSSLLPITPSTATIIDEHQYLSNYAIMNNTLAMETATVANNFNHNYEDMIFHEYFNDNNDSLSSTTTTTTTTLIDPCLLDETADSLFNLKLDFLN
ncbi:13948_t:CDS:2, partial [Entrophospora sp. SA101]